MKYDVSSSDGLDRRLVFTRVSPGCSHVKECMLGLVSAGDNTSQLSPRHGLEQRQTHCSGLPLPHFSLFFLLVSLNLAGFLMWSWLQEHKFPCGEWTDLSEHLPKHKVHRNRSLNNTVLIPAIVSGSLSCHRGSHTSERKYLRLFKHADSPHCSRSSSAWGQSSVVTLAKMGGLWWEGRKWTTL